MSGQAPVPPAMPTRHATSRWYTREELAAWRVAWWARLDRRPVVLPLWSGDAPSIRRSVLRTAADREIDEL